LYNVFNKRILCYNHYDADATNFLKIYMPESAQMPLATMVAKGPGCLAEVASIN
jgi:hypothetical protein